MKDTGKSILMAILGGLSAIWLLNPIPLPDDVIPILGNLDEAAAATMLIAAMAYFGLDITKLFGKARQFKEDEEGSEGEVTVPKGGEKQAKAKVVDAS